MSSLRVFEILFKLLHSDIDSNGKWPVVIGCDDHQLPFFHGYFCAGVDKRLQTMVTTLQRTNSNNTAIAEKNNKNKKKKSSGNILTLFLISATI